MTFDEGRLVYRDLRKLRGIWLAEDEAGVAEVIGPQGPEAYGLTGEDLALRLGGRRRTLKAALLDQTVLAGVGNLLADETLWRAGIHPARRYDELDREERRQLDRSLQQVLRLAGPRRPHPEGAQLAQLRAGSRSRPVPGATTGSGSPDSRDGRPTGARAASRNGARKRTALPIA